MAISDHTLLVHVGTPSSRQERSRRWRLGTFVLVNGEAVTMLNDAYDQIDGSSLD
jgi:hypothetical protein